MKKYSLLSHSSVCMACCLVSAMNLALLCPYQPFGPVMDTLDGAYLLGIHYAFLNGFIFGKDTIFNYGPLGVLAFRLPSAETYWLLVCSDLFHCIQLTAATSFLVIRKKWSHLLCLFCALWLSNGSLLNAELAGYLFFMQLFWTYTGFEQKRWIYLFPAVINALMSFFVKFNFGLISFLVLCFTFLLWFLKEDKRHALLGVSLSFLLLLALCECCGVSLWSYLVGGFEISRTFSESMQLTQSGREPYMIRALCTFIVLSITSLTLLRKEAPINILFTLVFYGFLFVVFKQGFVRFDGHEITFFLLMPFVGTLFVYLNQRYLVAVAAGIALSLAGREWLVTSQHFFEIVNRVTAYGVAITDEVKLPLDDRLLPPTLVSKIGSHSVDIFPWEITRVVGAELNYHPRPVFQSYQVTSGWLDGQNKRFYEGERAPEYVLFRNLTIDSRGLFFAEVWTKLSLLTLYEFIDKESDYLLFKRRDEAEKLEVAPPISFPLKFNRWVKYPCQGVSVLTIDVKLTAKGSFINFIYKPQRLRLQVRNRLHTPSVREYIAPRPLLHSGVMIAPILDKNEDILNLVSGRKDTLFFPGTIRILVEGEQNLHHYKREAVASCIPLRNL